MTDCLFERLSIGDGDYVMLRKVQIVCRILELGLLQAFGSQPHSDQMVMGVLSDGI